MKNPSPLFVWKLLLVVILGAGMYLYFVDPMPAIFERRDDKMTRHVQSVQFKEDESGIIFFGNSLMNQALPPNRKNLSAFLETEFQKKNVDLKNVSAVDITSGGIGAPRLHALADQFMSAGPTILVLQSEMFVSRSRKQNQPAAPVTTRLAQWSGVLQLRLFGTVAEQSKQKVKHDFLQSNQQKANVERIRQVQSERTLIVAREMWNNQIASVDNPIFVLGKQLVERFEKAGIEVIVVELPVSETAAQLAPPNYLKDRRRVLQDLEQVGATVVSYPNVLSNEYFRDYSHLNRKGRREFLRWFGPVLAEEVARS